jgi:hypothetical protein
MVAPGMEAFMHYMIDVQSLKLGDKELLNFKEKDIGIQAILDSGTSCLVRGGEGWLRKKRAPIEVHSPLPPVSGDPG